MPDKYNRIQETITAIQYRSDNKQEIYDLVGSKVKTSTDQESIMVKTPQGNIYVLVDDWVVMKPGRTFHIMRNDEFHEMYEPLNQSEIVTPELDSKHAKQILKDIRNIQEELRRVNVHLIETEKYFMLTLANFKNKNEDGTR